MRLRLLVPRRGRGRGLGGLAAAALVGAALALASVLLLAGDGDRRARVRRPPRLRRRPPPCRSTLRRPGRRSALGITEPNPSLVAAPGARGVPPEWARVAGRAGAHPAGRLPARRRLVRWCSRARTLRRTSPGSTSAACARCSRAPPTRACATSCARSRRASARAGWEGMVVITGTPEWAAAPRERVPRAASRFRAVRAGALPAYRQLIADVLAVARQEGADLRFFSPWNEPNHAYFLSPQRARCDAAAPSRAVGVVRALWRTRCATSSTSSRATSGCVLGETAGLLEPSPRATSVRGDDPRPAARAGVLGAGVVPARLHRRHRPGRDRHRRARRAPLPARARDLDHRDRRRPGAGGLLRSPAGSRASARAAGCCTSACALVRGTRASRSPCSTRSARTTCSRPASSPPTSHAPAPRSASGRRGEHGRARPHPRPSPPARPPG